MEQATDLEVVSSSSAVDDVDLSSLHCVSKPTNPLINFSANQTPQTRACEFERSKTIKFTSKHISDANYVDEVVSDH